MKKIYIILIFTLVSCSPSVKRVSFTENNKATVNTLLETFLTIPLELEVQGKYLYATDFQGDSLMWCYDIEKRKQVKRLLPRGEGPEEFLSPVQFFLSDSILFVHNRWHFSGRHYKYNIHNSFLYPLDNLIHFPTDIDMIYPLSEKRIIASGRFKDCRYIIMDEKGIIVSRCGDYPSYFEKEEDIPNFPKFMFHQSMFGFHKQHQRLASVTSHVFELWNYSKDTLSLYKRILLSPYKYSHKTGEQWASATAHADIEKGVERIYTTKNHIYMLYNANTEKMHREKKEKYNSEIWVFDWEGKPIQKISLDTKIICFCVDEPESRIYCVFNAPEPSIGEILIH